MSTATKGEVVQSQPTERVISFMPLGGKVQVELTLDTVRKFLCTPTKSGALPSNGDIIKFMALCRARELDPWVGDAYLCGYDSKDGPVFSLITAVQALLKRAEMNPNYDGMEYGVVVQADGKVDFRPGDLVFNGEVLIGGWARLHRKDQGTPTFDAIKLSTFDTQRSRWAKDPAGMIVKCAQASVLRTAFPTQLGGIYTREEFEAISHDRIEGRKANNTIPALKSLDELASKIKPQPAIEQQSPQQQPQSEAAEEETAARQDDSASRGHEAPAGSSGPAESEEEAQQRIAFVFATARGRGAAALEKCYADHCGPDSTMKLSDALYRFAADCYEDNKAKLAAQPADPVEQPKKTKKAAGQQSMLPDDGSQSYPEGQ